MDTLAFIREEEKKYHDLCYENYRLFEEGSWLYKPVKTVIDLIPNLFESQDPKVLDLGAGVGRNSIPIAQALKNRNGQVVCVDLLDSAIGKLNQYSLENNVTDIIQTVRDDIARYIIKPDTFDFIVAVSSLEHVDSEVMLTRVLKKMSLGTKHNGINCIIINSEVEEIDGITKEPLPALMEVNIKTSDMFELLRANYLGWDVMKQLVKPLEYTIERNSRPVILKTNAITFVVRKKSL